MHSRLFLVAALTAWSAAGARPVSGRFEGVDLAVAGTSVVGSYRESTGEGPASCAFTFRGTVDATGHGTIAASDGRGAARPGTIIAAADHVLLAVPGARGFAGCAMVLMPEIDQGISFSHTADADWTSLLRVTGAKVALRTAPAAATTHGYVVRDNIVGVVGRRAGWVEVAFHNDAGRTSRGWVAAGEVGPVPPAG